MTINKKCSFLYLKSRLYFGKKRINHNNTMIRSFILGGLLLLFAEMNAQEMLWPGDVNNNGIVNHIDVLYLGNAIGTVGPPRIGATTNWEEQEITTLWAEEFPNGVNYAYADCDGDGIISHEDFFTAIDINYGFTHGVIVPDDFDLGVPGVSPPLFFGTPSDPIVEGTFGAIPLNFGTQDSPVEDFYGVAFSIRVDPAIAEFGFFPFPDFEEFDEDWLDFDNGEPLISVRPNFAGDKVEIAISRTSGLVADSNFGGFGMFFIVIIDNVVGLGADQTTTPIYIEDVKLLNETGQMTPVVADSTDLIIFNDDLVNDTEEPLEQSIQVYPNPVREMLTIDSKNASIEQVELFDGVGQRLLLQTDLSTQKYNILSADYPSGVYHLTIQTTNGWLRKKVVIQH